MSGVVRDVPLTDEQRAALFSYRRGARQLGQVARSARFRERRAEAQQRGRALARGGDRHFIAGCMLYWAEGAKDRNSLRMTNADPQLLQFWIGWLRRWVVEDDERIAVQVNVHLGNGKSLAEIEAWWIGTLGVQASCLRRSTVNRASSASTGVRPPLVHGTVHLKVNSTDAVQLVFGAIQEYAGFERPEWLDIGTVPPRAA